MTRVAILGCGGRMGRMLIEAVLEQEELALAGGTERPGSLLLGQEIASLVGQTSPGALINEDSKAIFTSSDVVIDFTTPEASLAHVRLAAETGTALVIGTTGLTAGEFDDLKQAAEVAPLLYARNMSLGINLLEAVVRQVAAALDEDYDIDVLEMHHRHKVDAPSGTALLLGEAAAEGRGVDLAEKKDAIRDGITGARRKGDIGFAVLRGGDVPGEHSVIFATEGERLELTHRASNRMLFARGAVKAARWLAGRPAGLYGMKDVLGL